MDVSIERREDGVTIVRINENITFSSIKEFSELTENLATDGGRVIMDLSKVQFCNSHGFGAIINLYSRLAKRDGKLVLLNPQKPIREILTITQMNKIIEVAETEEEALKKLSA